MVLVGNKQDVEDMINILVLKVSNVHLKYLNLPLGFTFNKKAIWNFILEKKWRGVWPVGRNIIFPREVNYFIKSTLSDLPTFFISKK